MSSYFCLEKSRFIINLALELVQISVLWLTFNCSKYFRVEEYVALLETTSKIPKWFLTIPLHNRLCFNTDLATTFWVTSMFFYDGQWLTRVRNWKIAMLFHPASPSVLHLCSSPPRILCIIHQRHDCQSVAELLLRPTVQKMSLLRIM